MRVGGYGRTYNVFGLGSGEQNLVPYVSVAANDLPYGQTLYIPQLDGLKLGDGQRHNGCVRVDDDSWSFDCKILLYSHTLILIFLSIACQIDFFVPTYVDYLWLNIKSRASVKIVDCEVKNYITTAHLQSIMASTDVNIIPSLLHAKYMKE